MVFLRRFCFQSTVPRRTNTFYIYKPISLPFSVSLFLSTKLSLHRYISPQICSTHSNLSSLLLQHPSSHRDFSFSTANFIAPPSSPLHHPHPSANMNGFVLLLRWTLLFLVLGCAIAQTPAMGYDAPGDDSRWFDIPEYDAFTTENVLPKRNEDPPPLPARLRSRVFQNVNHRVQQTTASRLQRISPAANTKNANIRGAEDHLFVTGSAMPAG